MENYSLTITLAQIMELSQNLVNIYSLTSPYGHLSITDSSFGPRNVKNHTFPTSIIRTPVVRRIGSVPLVSVLKRFDSRTHRP